MTKDDIIRMAQEAGDSLTDKHGNQDFMFDSYGIERFAALIAAAEREACAKVCDKQANNLWQKNCDSEGHGADQCAAAIRARGQL